MKSVVADPGSYDWEGDAPVRRPWAETVIYEMHVAGFTRHASSGVEPAKRGTYAGLIEKIPYLQDLGVTAVELLPVFQFDPLHAPNGVNYWGYQPISFFAPHHAFSSRPDPLAVLDEFRDMVKALHRAGIEVILDVVYNHTAEGGQDGPTISYKGLGNDTYYILEKDRSRYADFTGCANTLNANQSIVRRMILDSLRYWVTEMHVDGFRFDLASILSRDENGHPLPSPPILWDIESDPLLAGTKLIAEAWDAAGLYQVGSFVGDAWQEWNGRFRDDVRSFVRGDNGTVCALASKLVGSPDVYGHKEREVEHSINFVTCHDGFTLNDLVSYNDKHNEANGEDNRDGAGDNRSWNCGVEGPTGDPAIDALRNRQMQEPPRDQSPVRRHADAHDGRRSAPHASRATTTPIARTTTSAGSTGASSIVTPTSIASSGSSTRTASAATRRAGSATAEPHAAPRTGQDPVERRRSRPPRLERPLAHAGGHAGKPARPLPAARDLQRVLGAARLRAAAGADELSRLAALHRHGAGVARRHLPRRRRAARSPAPATWRSRGRSSCSRMGLDAQPGADGGSDADRGRGEPDHRRRPQPRLHDRAARRVPRRVADDGRPVRDRRRTRPVSVVPGRAAAISRRSAASARRWSTPARGSACSSTRRGSPAASSRAAGSVRA